KIPNEGQRLLADLEIGVAAVNTTTAAHVAQFQRLQIRELPPTEPGWVQLFNGKNFAGWHVDERTGPTWKIDAAALVANGMRQTHNVGSLTKHFHLRYEVDVKTPGATIHFHVQEEGPPVRGGNELIIDVYDKSSDRWGISFGD